MRSRIFQLSSLSLALLHALPAVANDQNFTAFKPTQSDFGGVGLMQMPTGRVAPEGEFSVGATLNGDYRHYHSSLQLMPWLEATIRYTQVPDLYYSSDESFSGDTYYTDKGIDVKLRLWEETYWLPETSIGIRDMGGTGLFDGEFIAASKHIGPFDFTAGIAWGYMGNRANLKGDTSLGADCGRDTSVKGKGGSFDYSRWFTGCMSVFGGVEYQTPWAPLSLKAEYDANNYKSDFVVTRSDKEMPQDSPFNVGAVYRFGDWGDIRASYERGNTWTLGFTLKTNFNSLSQSWVDTPTPANAPQPHKDAADIDWERVANDLDNIAGYGNTKIYADNESVTVVGSQGKYRDRELAHEKGAMILANSGTSATQFNLVEQQANQSTTQTTIDATAYRKVANQEYVGASVSDATTLVNPSSPRGMLQTDTSKPWSVSFSPNLQQSIGGSEDFYLFNIGVSGGASYWLTDNIEFGGSVYVNLYDNYDKFKYDVPPDGTDLKRVRTLVRQYISDNPVRVSNLQLTAFDKFGDSVYVQGYGGYLETMFAGVGGEVLYRPLKSNWAFGMDVNYVAQRDPNTEFGIFTEERHYDPTTGRYYNVQTGTPTGHFTTYYRPEWSWFDDLLIKASVGQYLAEDKGVTLDVSKQFDSGVIAGAYMAKTNLSAEEFGEGSFNKGFYISIPFDIFTVKPSASRAVIGWTPLSRDGGQMLGRKYSLYSMTNGRYPGSEFTNRD
ncbi:YjbH domain-containing protein [Enterovibrio sp. ZSDZ42]|uniref:YjbH domain-containing protein n=1 Tax=Enterovibrio gelatinilyticus TaxID=2899819 RepID=A0ABT5R771_9GAMM|nr:YjbH domain-containing protein [Enterovibrio sp. ZSDZ42]MDD1796050.1 YjbH domain-containing protein [Enterovibrio sp. ZSDZ42]